MRPRIHRLCVTGLLAMHTLLLGWSAACHTPTIDEIGHLPAGLSHLLYGRFELYCVNPPLVRMVAALPVVLLEPRYDWKGFDPRPRARSAMVIGHDFIELNGRSTLRYFMYARWACLPFSLLGGWICLRWATALYGAHSGLVALSLWCVSPMILGHGALITPDVGAAACGATACFAYWRWLKSPTWKAAGVSGLLLGIAELAKSTWIILFVLWPLLWVMYRCSGSRERSRHRCGREAAQSAAILLLGLYVLNLGYLFEGSGRALKEYRFRSHVLAGETVGESGGESGDGNRFENQWLGAIPVPLPRYYLLGLDLQRTDFETGLWSYLGGEHRRGGWWYYYLYGLGVKVPLATWCLGIAAGTCGSWRIARMWHSRGSRSGLVGATDWRRPTVGDMDRLIPVIVAILLLFVVSSQTGFSHHLRYLLPAFPFAFVAISSLVATGSSVAAGSSLAAETIVSGQDLTSGGIMVARSATEAARSRFFPIRMALVWGLVGWASLSSLRVYPHSLSYFNESVGGPEQGGEHLNNSNLDWGQDLLFLQEWLESHPEARPMRLTFHGYYDPRTIGIDVTGQPVGLVPGWHAVSLHRLLSPNRRLAFFRRLQPVARVGYSIYVYRVTSDDVERLRTEVPLAELQSDPYPSA